MKSIEQIANSIASGEVSARAAVEAALKRAGGAKEYNIFLAMTAERALGRADEIDARIAAGGNPGRLAGVPFIAKDNFLTFGAPTTAASKMLSGFAAPYQATAIEKLEAEGAICIGKANLDSFAHGSSTENSAYGPTLNAIDKTRVAGGSSGGSAVGVALGIAPFALGSDAGGSIREPASFNGVVGVKPSYGMISRYGVVAMASSTDVVGPITATIADAEYVLEVLTGSDSKDSTTLPDYFTPTSTPTTGTVGVIAEFMGDDVDPEVLRLTNAAIEKYKSAGFTIKNVSLPIAPLTLAMYYIIVPAEVSSNLARYDGVRYGHSSKSAGSINELMSTSRSSGFMDENIRRIMIGSYVLSSGYADAYYQKAQKARTLLIAQFNELFETCDVLLGPVVPEPAFKLGQNVADPVKMYLADLMTVPSSLAGIPSLSLPIGVTRAGLPVGLQLMCQLKDDARMLALAKVVEKQGAHE